MTTIRATFTATATADPGSRRIIGTILPWGEVGHAALDGKPAKLRFARGGLVWDDPNAVKLVVDHLGDRPIFAGKARDLIDTEAGVVGTFSVSRTTAGDDVLVEAADGLRTGLSIEANLDATEPDADGVWTITADNPGRLHRVALVEVPAFASAQVTDIAAKETKMPETASTTPPEAADLSQVMAALSDLSRKLTTTDTPAEGPAEVPAAAAHVTAATAVTREPFPYGHAGATGSSYFRDLIHQHDDPDARQRVRQADAMWTEASRLTAANEPVTKSNVFIPNNYAIDLYVGQLRFPRVLVDELPRTVVDSPRPIPLPKFTSATADGGSGEPVAAHSEGVNPAQGELVIGTTTVTPAPYSGLFDINREALDGGAPGVDQIILTALDESYAQVTEAAAVTSILGTSGITAPTAVTTNADLEIEARAMAKQIRSEMAAFEARRGLPPDRVLFATDVYASALTAESASGSGLPLYPYFLPTNQANQVGPAGFRVNINGVEGRQAFKLTATKVLQIVNRDCMVWESGRTAFRWEEVGGPAKIRLALFGYFVAACLQPKGITLHTQA